MRSVLTFDQVLEAASWVWVPDGADDLQTPEYRLIRYLIAIATRRSLLPKWPGRRETGQHVN